jgi:hypothetical protein
MYNLIERTITLGHSQYPIEQFVVWFQTPLGLFDRLEDAIERLRGCDFDPGEIGMIVPVTVAYNNQAYEVMSR